MQPRPEYRQRARIVCLRLEDGLRPAVRHIWAADDAAAGHRAAAHDGLAVAVAAVAERIGGQHDGQLQFDGLLDGLRFDDELCAGQDNYY